MDTTRECYRCGRSCRIAEDQTDPAEDECTVDSLGLVCLNEWVCGECLADRDSI